MAQLRSKSAGSSCPSGVGYWQKVNGRTNQQNENGKTGNSSDQKKTEARGSSISGFLPNNNVTVESSGAQRFFSGHLTKTKKMGYGFFFLNAKGFFLLNAKGFFLLNALQ